MVGQELDDFDEQPQQPRKAVGLTLVEDDLEVGQYVCVLNLKRQPDDAAPIMGQSLHIKAICLPYFVGQLMSDPSLPILTLDCRYLNLMKVTAEFVKAQQEGAKQSAGMYGMFQPPQKPQKKKQE